MIAMIEGRVHEYSMIVMIVFWGFRVLNDCNDRCRTSARVFNDRHDRFLGVHEYSVIVILGSRVFNDRDDRVFRVYECSMIVMIETSECTSIQ